VDAVLVVDELRIGVEVVVLRTSGVLVRVIDRIAARVESMDLDGLLVVARADSRSPSADWMKEQASRIAGLPTEAVAWRAADGQTPLQDTVARLVGRIKGK
jgi:hypothetical protein